MLSLNGTTALSRRQKILEHIYTHTTFSDCEQTSKKKKSYCFPLHTERTINLYAMILKLECQWSEGFPGGSVVNNLPANAGDIGDTGSIPRSGRFPGGGNGNPLQYSCLENPMDRGA